jgi:ribosomal protein L11 methyltransferase
MISASLSDIGLAGENRSPGDKNTEKIEKWLARIWPTCRNAARVSRRGRSSVVERHLAKVDVVSSNLIARSIHPQDAFFRVMFVWSKLSPAKWVDAWEDRFSGNPNVVIEYVKGGKSVRVQVFCATREEADAIVTQFGGSVRELMAAEWNRPVPPPRPVKVRDVFLVTAETSPDALAALGGEYPGRQLISIPPEMAFGTGDHATTSTCLRMLVDIARKRGSGWTVADLGTGTGLLAIAARKIGSGPVYACDFDPFAVDVAIRNAERNGVDGIDVREQDILKWDPPAGGYDVVLANIFSTVLIQAWPVIAKSLAKGGDLVVSGILATQAWDVFTAAAAEGLGFPQVVRKGKWVTARGGHLSDLIAAGEVPAE